MIIFKTTHGGIKLFRENTNDNLYIKRLLRVENAQNAKILQHSPFKVSGFFSVDFSFQILLKHGIPLMQ
jgi:hypothetical protein